MTPQLPAHPEAMAALGHDLDSQFVIALHRNGRHWHASVTQGVFFVGETGSTTYRSRHRHRTVRRAMRTVARIMADHGIDHATVRVTER